ncbi:UNVERIFIED_CONTAM: Phosphoglycerate mutase-like protein AT74H [Sesamum latifolium]|uniref:Phosphoglycerate mutase-like protein AT74H n=1 Tax=Sesamum latifolium TaxID=2727402 RepID=A0AAW2YEV5_9LAMI
MEEAKVLFPDCASSVYLLTRKMEVSQLLLHFLVIKKDLEVIPCMFSSSAAAIFFPVVGYALDSAIYKSSVVEAKDGNIPVASGFSGHQEVVEAKDGTISVASAFAGHQEGVECGDGGPFGAVVVRNDEVVVSCHNLVLKQTDPTAMQRLARSSTRLSSQTVRFMPPASHVLCALVLSIFPELRFNAQFILSWTYSLWYCRLNIFTSFGVALCRFLKEIGLWSEAEAAIGFDDFIAALRGTGFYQKANLEIKRADGKQAIIAEQSDDGWRQLRIIFHAVAETHYSHHQSSPRPRERVLPKRIILVRHGESAGNIDGTAYTTTPDNKIPLTPQGIDQAKRAGSRICHVVSDGGASSNWKVYFYVSPYLRTRTTLREIGRAFPKNRVLGAREECRIREQDFGNFQVAERMKVIKETRERFGRFFYRFPEGESAADVYDRVSKLSCCHRNDENK